MTTLTYEEITLLRELVDERLESIEDAKRDGADVQADYEKFDDLADKLFTLHDEAVRGE